MSTSLLWSGDAQDFYDIPRVGLDYVIAPSFTIGGSLFATLPLSSTQKTTFLNTTTSRDDSTTSAFGIGVRAGYIAVVTPRISFWGRGGLSYTHIGTEQPQNDTSQSLSQVALNLEPLFVIRAAPHFGVQLGPVFDIPLSGTYHSEVRVGGGTGSTDVDASQLHIGLTAGLLGWF